MALQFTQDEIEEALDEILVRSDRKEISRITGIYHGVIKGMFNPDDERKSAVYVFLQILCALDEISDERGDTVFQKITEFRELSKKRRANISICLSTETGKLNMEIADFVRVKLENKPYEIQFAELIQAEEQLGIVKKGLIDEYNAQREKFKSSTLKIVN